MALRYGSLTTPDEGQNSYLEAYFGNDTLTVSPTFYNKLCVVDCDRSEQTGGVYKVNNTVIETTSISYLPSDKFKKRNQSEQYYEAIDGFLYYEYASSIQGPFIPSPYLKDGSRNLSYSQTEAPSSTLNALSDFNGKSHTELLCSQATAQENWQTAAQITNSSGSGYQTAACICWRYHTLGTNQGDWYIPACGELGYVLVLLEKIDKTIEYLKNYQIYLFIHVQDHIIGLVLMYHREDVIVYGLVMALLYHDLKVVNITLGHSIEEFSKDFNFNKNFKSYLIYKIGFFFLYQLQIKIFTLFYYK